MNIEKFCEENKQEVLKWYAKTQGQGDKITLDKAFVDLDGKQYYRFSPALSELPMERIGKMQDFLLMMGTGLDEEELNSLMDVCEEQLALAMSGGKCKFSIIGAAFNEIRNRQNMLLHHKLLYQYMAVQFVREDEPKNHFVPHIQNEKVKAMEALVHHNGDYNFFLMPELKAVSVWLASTPEEWETHYQSSIREIDRLKRKAELLRGAAESLPREKTGATP